MTNTRREGGFVPGLSHFHLTATVAEGVNQRRGAIRFQPPLVSGQVRSPEIEMELET